MHNINYLRVTFKVCKILFSNNLQDIIGKYDNNIKNNELFL